MNLLEPASHRLEVPHALDQPEAKTQARQQAARLGWRLVAETDERLTYRVGLSWQSWGEVVTLTFGHAALLLTSRCWWPSQSFDWGKNRRNCDAFARGYGASGAGVS